LIFSDDLSMEGRAPRRHRCAGARCAGAGCDQVLLCRPGGQDELLDSLAAAAVPPAGRIEKMPPPRRRATTGKAAGIPRAMALLAGIP